MIDRKIETGIKSVKSFLEFWVKFHSLYNEIISKEIISKEDEDKFLETKSILKAKYEEMKKGMDFNYMPHARPTDPVNDILALATVRFISEKNLEKVEGDWKDSYIFLNNILERLKDKKRWFEQLNPVGEFFRRMIMRTRTEG